MIKFIDEKGKIIFELDDEATEPEEFCCPECRKKDCKKNYCTCLPTTDPENDQEDDKEKEEIS